MMYSKQIPDKQYLTLKTVHAAEIIKGLEQSKIPYYVKVDDDTIYLTFSAESRSVVDEITKKAESGDYEEMMLSLSEKKSDGYVPIYKEIADILYCSVGSLTNRPPEIVEMIAKTYINYWHSDRQTIQKALECIIDLNAETESELSLTNPETQPADRRKEDVSMKNVLILTGVTAAAAVTFTLWCCIRINHRED